MFSPSLDNGALGLTRKAHADARSADAIHGFLDWASQPKPTKADFFSTKHRLEAGAATRRVLFTGKFWMTDEPVAAWRPVVAADDAKHKFRPVSEMRGQLLDSRGKSGKELALEPLNREANMELQSLKHLAELELRVEVVRFQKPSAGATGVTTGKVLAVSENYAAQQVGKSEVLVHENKNLSRPLAAGEKATLAYENGKATVFDGLTHDINIVAPWMPKDQQGYLRMTMLDALSQMTAPQSDDERLRDAMRYALESTANFFGVQQTRLQRADINLVVNEKHSVIESDTRQARPSPSRRP